LEQLVKEERKSDEYVRTTQEFDRAIVLAILQQYNLRT